MNQDLERGGETEATRPDRLLPGESNADVKSLDVELISSKPNALVR
jgi:hypothetical protein